MILIFIFSACKDNEVRPVPDIEEEYIEEVAEPEGKDIMQTLKSEAELSNFAMLMEAEELPFYMTDEQLFTVFAPDNNAFPADEKMGEPDLLSNYFVKTSYTPEELLQIAVTDSSSNSFINSLSGEKIYLKREGETLQIKGSSGKEAKITRSIQASNGIIHIIDNSLWPI
ncbi:fasciclin domain-containing protein [Antarcticibacterium sp. 1MA-6-2]|uniref:fasciclin domain-containing protein n=1 Tax=Antarcticibacterium sp. 1MA-6-2 TaxID=2908210 RepID=UPI001F3F2B97|nr:fasciclin domain-containing protein [Antarcticibacterium sp. 1MA-6-2]UJH92456.1 fasciclin domain-containing protein [Antarcticibacterium sp. 1MA-6-2]